MIFLYFTKYVSVKHVWIFQIDLSCFPITIQFSPLLIPIRTSVKITQVRQVYIQYRRLVATDLQLIQFNTRNFYFPIPATILEMKSWAIIFTLNTSILESIWKTDGRIVTRCNITRNQYNISVDSIPILPTICATHQRVCTC